MADRYEPFVSSKEIRPLPQGDKYAAKVDFIVKNPGPNSERLPGLLGEWWGKTTAEAEAKALAAAENG